MNFFLNVLLLGFMGAACAHDVEFVIVTPTYNNELWCVRNIQSVECQTYLHWHMVIINDRSTDNTSLLIHAYIQEHHLENKITMIDNLERKGALRNLYETIHACPDESVVITLDGDDWLSNEHVLERVAREYQSGDVWLTYGQYKNYPSGAKGMCRDFPQEVMKNRTFRSYQWISSHLRTFKAGLFKRIKTDDLKYNGEFFEVTWDLAMMYPMLEMASRGHIRCIPDVLYVYNVQNPLNDFKQRAVLQEQLDKLIRRKPVYEAL